MNQCPWSGFTRGSTNFCEAPLCSWVESPGIAWAGFIYIAVGIYLFTRQSKTSHWLINLFPWFAITMGVGSALYHASHTFMFQALDVAGMFLLGNALIWSNLFSIKQISVQQQKIFFWSTFILETGLFILLKSKSGSVILGILILIFLVTEFMLKRERQYLWISLTLFALATSALWIEHRSGLCNPHNHVFQWHAVWDGLCAFTYITLHKYLRTSDAPRINPSF